MTTAPEALYVDLSEVRRLGDAGGPEGARQFENRKDLPEAWGGHADAELAAITGVPDAMFAHIKRFYASAARREGILALPQALDARRNAA